MVNILDSLVNSNSSILIFFLIVAGNFVEDVYSCNLRKKLEKIMPNKHIISFLLLYVFVILLEKKDQSPIKALLISVCVYIWFILTMRAPFYITLLNMILIFIIYFIDINHKYYFDKEKNTDGTIPFNLSEKTFIYSKYVLIISMFILTTIGVLYQMNYTRNLYIDEWNIYDFMVGLPNDLCFGKHVKP